MINHLLRFDLSVLHVDLVAAQHSGYAIADVLQVAVPGGNVTVSHSSRHVKHDDGALGLDVVAVSESTKLLLAGRVPHVEPDGPSACVEDYGMDLHTHGGCVHVRTYMGH